MQGICTVIACNGKRHAIPLPDPNKEGNKQGETTRKEGGNLCQIPMATQASAHFALDASILFLIRPFAVPQCILYVPHLDHHHAGGRQRRRKNQTHRTCHHAEQHLNNDGECRG